jgi:fido (protein-threonine AMPylation protein)
MADIYNFEEYKRLGEPSMLEKSGIWQAAIGLQQVDGLTPSDYLIKTAKQNIEGEITIYEVQERLDGYYKANPVRTADDRTEEADKVSARIAEILSEKTFSFSPAEYITLHKRLFTGIYKHAGKIRDYNISKEEWVLNGKTVYYASADSIRATLDYDFGQEKSFSYKGLSSEQIVKHITNFVSGLWQIHAFGEGNTRTTAVFTIKYLRTIGFSVTNDLFANHSWYFRNALVRANYNDYKNKIYSTFEYLNRFFGNLLLGENNSLRNRELRALSESGANVPVKTENVPVNVPVKRRDGVLRMLHADPDMTADKLAAVFSVTAKTIKRDFTALKNEGKIKRIGSDKTGHWEIIEYDSVFSVHDETT